MGDSWNRPVDIGWEEYAVFGFVLGFSISIGIYYGFFGTRQKTTKEYLLANRAMSPYPVAVSMVCSAISAITFLGNPVEIYLYGTQYSVMILCFIPFSVALLYLYIPVYYQLHVSSVYEYIQMRFNNTTRIIVSLMGVTHVVVSMAIVVFAPCLAINQVTGLSTKVSTACIYFVCIFYSSLGGLKAVLWTDVFQAFIMVTALVLVAVKGTIEAGGLGEIWQRALDGNRIEFLNFSVDPKVRHTVWTGIIGGYFFWTPAAAATQTHIQRFMSMPDLKTAKIAVWINFLGLVLLSGLCSYTGLVLFANYFDCDPIATGAVSKSDQLLPLFVSQNSRNLPGLQGLFLAGLVAASMSSLSSGLSALASITTYDYVSRLFPSLSDTKLSKISKINCCLLGLVSYSFVFVVENAGNVLPVASSFLGIMLGPTLGLFSLGMFLPWANTKGSVIGMISAMLIMTGFMVGNIVASNQKLLPDQTLPVGTGSCSTTELFTSTSRNLILADFPVLDSPFSKAENASNIPFSDFSDSISNFLSTQVPPAEESKSWLVNIVSMSYMWNAGLGCALAFVFGTVFSFAFRIFGNEQSNDGNLNPLCLSPLFLRFWTSVCPKETAKILKSNAESNGVSMKQVKKEQQAPP